MSDETKLDGRKAALAIVQKINQNKAPPPEPETFDGLIRAIELLAKDRPDMSGALAAIAERLEGLVQGDADFSTIVEAISGLKFETNFDVEPISAQLEALAKREPVDLSPVVDQLKEIKKAIAANTDVLANLVAVARLPKVVQYDAAGRITEIGVK